MRGDDQQGEILYAGDHIFGDILRSKKGKVGGRFWLYPNCKKRSAYGRQTLFCTNKLSTPALLHTHCAVVLTTPWIALIRIHPARRWKKSSRYILP